MKKLTLSLIVMISLMLMMIGSVSAATITVCSSGCDHTTIQAAIDAATAGDTITVAAGTYVGDLTITTDDLEIVGADKTTTTIKGVANLYKTEWPSADPNIDIQADGVKIHGFTIQGPAYMANYYASGIVLDGQNIEIYDNDFVTVKADTTDELGQAITTYSKTAIPTADVSGLNIHDNTFTGSGLVGTEAIYINPHTGTGTITIENNEFSGSIFIGISAESGNIDVIDNTIDSDVDAWYGVRFFDTSYAATYDNIVVTGNTIQGFDLAGIRVGNTDTGTSVFVATLSSNTFTSNTNSYDMRNGASVTYNANIHNVLTGENIQTAIDGAEAGDVINVAAGTYNERVNIDKSLTLEGANAGVPVTGVRGPESIINPQGLNLDFGVLIDGADTIATFDGFTVENYKRVGILAGAFSLENDPAVVHILNNIVTEPIGQQNNNCIQVGDGTTGTVIGNEVSGANLESPDWSGSGILVAGSSNVVVSENYVHNCEGGIQIVGYLEYRDAPAVNNLIENNIVEDSETGISVQMNSIGTIIRYNDVLNNDEGIAIIGMDSNSWGGGEHSVPSGTEVHYNNIAGNDDGVSSGVWYGDTGLLAEEVDAENNWWNACDGPSGVGSGSGDSVSTMVNYDPWIDCTNVGGDGQDFIALTVQDSINYGNLYSAPGFETAAQEFTLTNVGSLDVVVIPIFDSGAEVFKRIKFSDTETGTYDRITGGEGTEGVYTTIIGRLLISNDPLEFSNPVIVWTKIKIAIGDTLAKLVGPQTGTIYFQAVEA